MNDRPNISGDKGHHNGNGDNGDNHRYARFAGRISGAPVLAAFIIFRARHIFFEALRDTLIDRRGFCFTSLMNKSLDAIPFGIGGAVNEIIAI